MIRLPEIFRHIVVILLIFIAFANQASCQNQINKPDSALIKTITSFEKTIAAGSFLYSGKEYAGYGMNIKGNPFFFKDSLLFGNIFYDGHLFENVPLLYDLVKQAVIIQSYDDTASISLANEKIKYFTLNGHEFENMRTENGNVFYDVMYNKKAGVWIKRVKVIRRALHAEDRDFYVETDELYIKKNNSLFLITNKSSLLQAFDDRKNELKIFIRKNKFKFKKNIENDLIKTASYYSSLQ